MSESINCEEIYQRVKKIKNPKEPINLKVKYKFKDDKKSIIVIVSEIQYVNLCALPIIEECDILDTASYAISEAEKNYINQKIQKVCLQDQSLAKCILQ